MNRRAAPWVMIVGLAIPALSPAQENVYNKALPSTVWIVQPVDGGRIRMGSGTLIDVQKRLVLTNFHVVGTQKDAVIFFPILDGKKKLVPERDKYMELLRSGAGIAGKVKFTESSKDLAVIELASVPKGAPALRLAKDSATPGDRVHSIGSPGVSGALFNYTDGSVKSVYKKRYKTGAGPNDPNGFTIDSLVLETSSATNKGDSGGPLMNDKCELVGVTQGIMIGGEDTRSVSYFIDVTEVRALLKAHKITLSTPAATVASDTPLTTKPPAITKPAETTAADPKAEKRKREEAASGRLSGAKLFVKSNPKKAREMLEDIVEQFPGTDAAAEAKKLLNTIK